MIKDSLESKYKKFASRQWIKYTMTSTLVIKRKAKTSVATQPTQAKDKVPVKKTIGLKETKLDHLRVARAKDKILKLQEAHKLRPCYIDQLALRAVYHGKDNNEVWLKEKLKAYQLKELKHYLRLRLREIPEIAVEKRQEIFAERLAINFDKQTRKAGFNPDFTQFFFFEEFQILQEMFGKACWYFMKRNLKDLSRISPLWACQFLTALGNIDQEKLKMQSDKYAFITGSSEFKEAQPARQIFLEKLTEKFMTKTIA